MTVRLSTDGGACHGPVTVGQRSRWGSFVRAQNMFAMLCSNPMAVNAKTGHQTETILETVSFDESACHHARQTSCAHPHPHPQGQAGGGWAGEGVGADPVGADAAEEGHPPVQIDLLGGVVHLRQTTLPVTPATRQAHRARQVPRSPRRP